MEILVDITELHEALLKNGEVLYGPISQGNCDLDAVVFSHKRLKTLDAMARAYLALLEAGHDLKGLAEGDA